MDENKTMDENDINSLVQRAGYRRTVYDYYYPFIMYDETAVQISSFLPEIEDYYYISNYGKCYNAKSGYLITPTLNSTGFVYYTLRTKSGSAKFIGAHILVCTAFNGNPPSSTYIVKHVNGDKTENYYKNLEWASSKINDKYWEGEAYANAQYDPEQIHHICKLLQSGITDAQTICSIVFREPANDKYKSLISKIRNRESWTGISSQYNICFVTREFTSDEDVHKICRYLEIHPHGPYDVRSVLAWIGVDITVISNKARNRYASIICQIRNRTAYVKISSNYNF